MTTRRRVLAGLLASGLVPAASWADAGSPAYLAAARRGDGRYILVGLTAEGLPLFDLPLPARGHAAAAHPKRPEAVAFARRPGRFARVLDCSTGELLARLKPFANVRLVVIGHIHNGFYHHAPSGPAFYGCPSTCLQVAPPRPQPHQDQPGFRLLWLYADGTHQTAVKRVSAVQAS